MFSNRIVVTLSVILALFTMAGGSLAQTIGYADAIKILANSCGNDIQKFCSKANLANNEIQSCLKANESQVSPQCKADYARVFMLISARYAAQQSATKICARDVERFCTGMKRAKGYTLQCLLKKPRLSKKCRQVLVDAGWASQ